MELDDFKSAWQALDQKLDRQAALSLQLLRESRGKKARHGLRPLAWGQAVQIALGTLLVLFSVGFWSQHRQVPHLLFIGLLFHVYGLALVGFGIRIQVLIHRLDFGAPVLHIQSQLAQLRRFYVVGGLWLGLPWWLLWMPFMVMVFMGLFGVDLMVNLPHLLDRWILWNGVTGAAGFMLTLLFLKWAKGRPALARKVENAAAGTSLNRARRMLEEIARFEGQDLAD